MQAITASSIANKRRLRTDAHNRTSISKVAPMVLKWSKQKESVAHHEAGHRVMGSIEGAPPKDISLRLNVEGGTWEGDVLEFRKSETESKPLILIAYAGLWAEIKYQARRHWPDATFDPKDRPTRLILALQEPESDDSMNPEVMMLTPAGPESFPIDQGIYSDDADQAHDLAGGDEDLIEQLLLQVRDKLDEPAVWSAVAALAEALIDRLGDGHEVTIPAAEAEKVIQAILGQSGTKV